MATTTITVKNSEGTILSGATVTLGGASTLTDSNGQAIFDYTDLGFSAGTYTATTTLSGYTSANIDVIIGGTNDASGTITLTVTSTEGESTLPDITDAAKTAAETAATAAATELANAALAELTKTDESGQTLIEKGTTLITKLTREIGTTNDWFVKFIRNPAEIVVLTGLIVGAGAGVASAISELKDKLK